MAVKTTRTTAQQISETRNVRDVHDKIMLFDPEEAPLITFLNALRRRKAVKAVNHEWFERDYVPRWTQNGAAAIANNTNSTTITVVDGTLFIPGDLFVVPKAVASSGAPEMCRVTVVAGNVLTVIRDVGGAGVDTIDANGAIRVIGDAHEEDGILPSPKKSQPVAKNTYLQIAKTVTAFSNTAIAVQSYGVPESDRDYEHKMDMVEHKRKLNDVLLWGRTSQDLTGGPNSNPIRTAMGFRSVISTNIMDAGGTLTRKKFAEFARMTFRYGRKTKILLAAPILKQAINEWAVNFLMVKPAATQFGVRIQEVETAHGTFALVNDWMLENGISGKNGFGSLGFGVDLDEITYLYLNNNGLNRDTKVFLDVVKNGQDGKRDQIVTEFGYRVMRENRHSMLYNITDYMQ